MKRTLLYSQVIAFVYWFFGWVIGAPFTAVDGDQRIRFYGIFQHIGNPYVISRFANPPWTALILYPLHWFPFWLATLLQSCLTLGLLTLVIYAYGGKSKTVYVSLLSFFGFIAIEFLSIDWLVYLGLLLPSLIAAPFMLVKPQLALGVLVTRRTRAILAWSIGAGIIVLASFLLWGNWLGLMLDAARSLAPMGQGPAAILGYPLSLAIGAALLIVSRKKRDKPLSIIAWFFCAPYVGLYGFALPFAMVAIKWPRLALVVSIGAWLIVACVLLWLLFHGH